MLALFFQLQPPAVSNGVSYNTYANRIQSRAIIYSTYNKHKTLGLRSVSVVGWYQYTQSTMKFDVACSQRRQQWNEEGGRGGAPRRSSPATTGAPSSTWTALNDCGSFFWRLSYFYFLYFNTIICTFGSLHFLKTPPSRHHKTDFHPTRRKRRKQTERRIEREEKLMWPNQLTQNVDIWCPGN